MFVRQSYRADERPGLAETVTIAAAGHEQMKFIRDPQVTLGHGGGMFRVKTFNAVKPGIHQRRDDVIRPVQAGMRHHGQTARLMDQVNAFARGHFCLWHPCGPTFFEKTFEGLVEVPGEAFLHEGARYVRPAG